MTAEEYRKTLVRLGFSQVKAAKILGVDPRTSRRWALGETDVPHCVGLALKLIEERQKLGLTVLP
jgi:hypothetical protein